MRFKTVLIVDDAYFMRNLLKKALKEAGYDVVGEAKNGKEGIKLYFELKPDVVTMDIAMPEMSGVGATKQILSKDPTAQIIVVTGNNDEAIQQEIMQAGAKEYLQKPFQPAFLWSKLDKMQEGMSEEQPKMTETKESVQPPVVSDDGIEDNFEIIIQDKPDESKSQIFEIKNSEDDIEFPNSFQIEEEQEAHKLSQENIEKIEQEQNDFSPLEKEESFIDLVEEEEPPVTASDSPDIEIREPEIRNPVMDSRESSVPFTQPPMEPSIREPHRDFPIREPKTKESPSIARESSIREPQHSPREVVVEPPRSSATVRPTEPLVSTVEITKSKKTDRKIEEINIRPQNPMVSEEPVNIKPPRGRILREESYDRLANMDIEEPILNDSSKDNYNNGKNDGLFGIVKKLFKK
ncbi:response regulator [Aneurinibacillus sp. Ricciae_BoGa-3]|uniref:response regulator n=1 Tax=Aneurinibacillus sp. Ricciae_BoGa-3 TaxID=3022697 RepID=UPI002FEE0E47